MSFLLNISLYLTHLADRCMKPRTKVPRGYSACRISLIDLGPQLSRQLLGCILVHRPTYIQHGLHQAVGIPCVIHTSILLIPTHRVGTSLECDDNHTYSHHALEEKASFPIMIAAQDAYNFQLFNCNPLQLNTCLYQQSL